MKTKIAVLVTLYCLTFSGWRCAAEEFQAEAGFADSGKSAVGLRFEVYAHADGKTARNSRALYAATTNADGVAKFPLIHPGEYDVAVDDHGFGMFSLPTGGQPFQNYVWPSDPIRVDLAKGELKTVQIELQPGGTLTGKVLTTDGTPVTNGLVNISSDGSVGGYIKNGKLRLSGIKPQSLQKLDILSIEPADCAYTFSLDLVGKTLGAGDTIDVGEVRLKRLPQIPNVHGVLMDAAAQSTHGIRLLYAKHASEPMKTTLVAIDGKLNQSLLPGKYHLFNQRDGEGHPFADFEVPASGIAELHLTAPSTATAPSTSPTTKEAPGTRPSSEISK